MFVELSRIGSRRGNSSDVPIAKNRAKNVSVNNNAPAASGDSVAFMNCLKSVPASTNPAQQTNRLPSDLFMTRIWFLVVIHDIFKTSDGWDGSVGPKCDQGHPFDSSD